MVVRLGLRAYLRSWLGLLVVAGLFFSVTYTDYRCLLHYQSLLSQQEVLLTGIVVGQRKLINGFSLDLIPTGIFLGNSVAKLRVFCSEDIGHSLGSKVIVQGKPAFSRQLPPQHWLYWNPFSLRGYTVTGFAGGVQRIGNTPMLLRGELIQNLVGNAGISSLSKGLLTALVLGERSYLDDNLMRRAAEVGVAHLLALSGMHLGFYIFFFTVFSGNRVPKLARLLGIALFILLSGISAAAWRAAVAGLYSLLAEAKGVSGFSKEGLCRILLLMLWLNPAYLFDLGFRLSVTAVWGLGLWRQLGTRVENKVFNACGAGFLVSTALLPLNCAYFGYLSPWGPFFTILLLPLIGTLILLGLLALLVGALGWGNYYWRYCGGLADWLSGVLQQILLWGEHLPGSSITVGTPGLLIMVLAITIFISKVKAWGSTPAPKNWQIVMRCWGLYLAISLLFSASYTLTQIGARASPWMAVTMLDVGHGDACYLRLPGGIELLVDSGGGRELRLNDWIGARVVNSFLTYNGTVRLDCVFISHWHTDHYVGLAPVLNQVRTEELVTPGGFSPPFLPVPQGLGRIRGAQRGLTFSNRKVIGTIWYPGEYTVQMLNNPNLGSVVLEITYGEFSMLFCGDLPPSIQNRLAKTGPYPVTVLKVPHHGGRSLSEKWLGQLNPELALISGRGPQFGQPRVETETALAAARVNTLQTSSAGNILLRTNGGAWQVATTAYTGWETSVGLEQIGFWLVQLL